MKKNLKLIVGSMAAVLACSSAFAVPATGNATLFLWDGTAADNKTVVDESAQDHDIGTPGDVGFHGAVGSVWTLNVDTGLSTGIAPGGSSTTPVMDLNFSHTSSSAAGTINIAFFDNDFTGGSLAKALASIGGTFLNNATLTYSTYTRSGDVAPTLGATGLDLSVASGWKQLTTQTFSGTGSFSSDKTSVGSISGGAAGDYSLLQVITLTVSGASLTTGDSSLISVPDGGTTLMLLGSSLTALGLVRRSLKKS